MKLYLSIIAIIAVAMASMYRAEMNSHSRFDKDPFPLMEQYFLRTGIRAMYNEEQKYIWTIETGFIPWDKTTAMNIHKRAGGNPDIFPTQLGYGSGLPYGEDEK